MQIMKEYTRDDPKVLILAQYLCNPVVRHA